MAGGAIPRPNPTDTMPIKHKTIKTKAAGPGENRIGPDGKTKQRRYRDAKIAEGICGRCGQRKLEEIPEAGVILALCDVCREKARVYARNRYRRMKGLPLDAPVNGRD